MSAKKTTKTTKATTEKKTPKAPKVEQAPQVKKQKAESGKLSALDAAAKVLADAGQAMSCPDLIEAMTKAKALEQPQRPDARSHAVRGDLAGTQD